MRVGVPKEIKSNEYRVGLVPAQRARADPSRPQGARRDRSRRTASASTTSDYRAAGATIAASAAEVFAGADMIVKVKEPQPERDRDAARRARLLFTYLHLAPDPEQTKAPDEVRRAPPSPTRP